MCIRDREIGGKGFLQNVLHVAHAHAGVVLEAAPCQADHLVLHVGDLTHAGAAKVALLNGIVSELGLRCIDDNFAVLGLAVGAVSYTHLIIQFAQRLNIVTVAEGIETQADKTLVQTLNCNFGQGYFYDKPLAAQDFSQKYME